MPRGMEFFLLKDPAPRATLSHPPLPMGCEACPEIAGLGGGGQRGPRRRGLGGPRRTGGCFTARPAPSLPLPQQGGGPCCPRPRPSLRAGRSPESADAGLQPLHSGCSSGWLGRGGVSLRETEVPSQRPGFRGDVIGTEAFPRGCQPSWPRRPLMSASPWAAQQPLQWRGLGTPEVPPVPPGRSVPGRFL